MATLTNTAKSADATLTNTGSNSATLTNTPKRTKAVRLSIGDGFFLSIGDGYHLNIGTFITESVTNSTKN